jgi:hypothetical protein|eukprot:g8511.t1
MSSFATDQSGSPQVVVTRDTVSELKDLFGIADSSSKKQQRRVSTAKDFAVVLSAASAGRALQGDDFLHLLSGYVQANLPDLRNGMLRLSLNTPCLSYLSSLVKKSQSKGQRGVSQNRRIVLKLAVMLLDLAHLKVLSPKKPSSGNAAARAAPLAVKCQLNMFANLRMLEIHGAEFHNLEGIAYLRDRLEGIYVEGSNVTCPGMVLFEPDRVPNPPGNTERPTPEDMLTYHDTEYVWPRLESVKFCNCGMTVLDRSVAFLPKGRVFDFSYNELESSSFKALALVAQSSIMTTVDLAFNRLSSCASLPTYLPRSVSSRFRPSLQSLILRHNRLSTTKGLEILVNLQRLDLSHNILSSLDEIMHLQRLQKLRSLGLEGNPIALLATYREQVGDAFATRKVTLKSDFKFVLDGQAVKVSNSMLKAGERLSVGDEHLNFNTSPLQSRMRHEEENGKNGVAVAGKAAGVVGSENSRFDLSTADYAGRSYVQNKGPAEDKPRRKGKKSKKKLATIEDPSALAVPISPPRIEAKRRNTADRKRSKAGPGHKQSSSSGAPHAKGSRGNRKKSASSRARGAASKKQAPKLIQHSSSDAWDEMEEYKRQVQRKMEQFQNRLNKKREVEGANWLESKDVKPQANELGNFSDQMYPPPNPYVNMKMTNAPKPKKGQANSLSDNAKVGEGAAPEDQYVAETTVAAAKKEEDLEAERRPSVGDFLYQCEYLAERHDLAATNDSSYQKLSIKTCVILVQGSSFIEVDVATGAPGLKKSLDNLIAVELMRGQRGDTLLHVTFQHIAADQLATSKTDNYYVLRQAGTLEELRSLLKARLIYNIARRPEYFQNIYKDRGDIYNHMLRDKTSLQCLSCEYKFQWSYEKQPVLQCDRCNATNLRTTNQASPTRNKPVVHIKSPSADKAVKNFAKTNEARSDRKTSSSGSDSFSDEGDEDGGAFFQGNAPVMDNYVDWDYFSQNGDGNSKDDPSPATQNKLKQLIDEKLRARKEAVQRRGRKNGSTPEGHGAPSSSSNRAISEEYDPLANLSVLDNLEIYFRERVFCSRANTSERVVYMFGTKMVLGGGARMQKSSKSSKPGREEEMDVVVVFTDESLHFFELLKANRNVSLTFKDAPKFPILGKYTFLEVMKVSIGFWAQRLCIKTKDGVSYMLLTRDRDRTYAILQRVPSNCEIINEDQYTLGILQQYVLKDPSANITLFLMLYRRHKDKKRIMPRTLVLTNKGIYLCEEYFSESHSVDNTPMRVERHAALGDIVRLEASDKPTDFTIVCTEMFGIIPRKRRWRLRVHSRAAKARVLQELRKLMRERV